MLGVKRAPSEFDMDFNLQMNGDKNCWMAQYMEKDLTSSKKRIKLYDDSFLKESVKDKSKLLNKDAVILAVDSDDAMDYLRVRKQNGENIINKLTVKKSNVFDISQNGEHLDKK